MTAARSKGAGWLQTLRPIDRLVAKRWLGEVGSTRFYAIARAAAASPRPAHRPRKNDYDVFADQAMRLWLRNSSLSREDAALQTARRVVSEPGNKAWLGRAPITEPALRKRIREAVRAYPPEALELLHQEAIKARQQTRFDIQFPQLSGEKSGSWMRRMELDWKQPAWSVSSQLKWVEDLTRGQEKLRQVMTDHMKIGRVVEALDGLIEIDPQLPVSVVARNLMDFVDVLKEQQAAWQRQQQRQQKSISQALSERADR
ncbi:hypothetical protein RQ831_05490 [Roseomonas gilardii]|uniref:Uncharacterized protein n=1 Tax=Roseomonas gilardii TaxID=257708 RepID=A0ABU3MCC4_9PROT|nr:hypothetical protein [Roseomonas gilardii]MDT8330499.1 hypothetical protein [Roseomonas gilardii]